MKQHVQTELYPVALTVAGSDSGGGAGVQADLRTFNAFGVFGCSAITAVTAQNPDEVRRIDLIPPEGVRAQIETVLARIAVCAAKTGMLGCAANIRAAAEVLKTTKIKLVVDPVMVSTSGAKLLPDDAIETLRAELLPRADFLTPNLPEAELLLARKLAGSAEYAAAAREIAARWECVCVLKTGHAQDLASATDFAALPDGRCYAVTTPRLPDPGKASHGTGCTFSAALAAVLAQRQGWKTALAQAKSFVYGSLSEPALIGKGLNAMYPPVEDYDRLVKIAELG